MKLKRSQLELLLSNKSLLGSPVPWTSKNVPREGCINQVVYNEPEPIEAYCRNINAANSFDKFRAWAGQRFARKMSVERFIRWLEQKEIA